jgi:outer membrane receptor for ferrienterochelin and colicins
MASDLCLLVVSIVLVKKIALYMEVRAVRLLAAGLLVVHTANAEEAKDLYDLPLDQLVNVEVSSASRFTQKASEAPSAVEVLTADDISRFGWRNLADALNAIRGLYVRNDRTYSFLGNRGFAHTGDYNARVLFMVDGRRMNDAVYDQANIAEESMLDVSVIDRIEYIPGSGSSVYGANAVLGVVNIITKQGKAIDGLKVGGEVGSFKTFRGRAAFGKQWQNGADLLLSGSHYGSKGDENLFFPEFAGEPSKGVAYDLDREHNDRLFGKFSYGGFTLRSGYANRYKRVPTASFGAAFNQLYYYVDRQIYIDADYNTEISPGLSLELRGFNHWYNYRQYQPNVTEDNKFYINHDFSSAHWWGGEIKLTGTQFKHHKWLAGLEVQRDERQYQAHYNQPNPTNETPFSSGLKGWRVGVYAQDEWRIADNLLINAGLRLDYHHMIKTLQLHPRIGLIWDITPTFTTKLLYGSAFRAPNAYERSYAYNDSNAANPNNKEELVYSHEAVAEWYPGNGLKLLATVFYNKIEQLLVQNEIDGHPNQYSYENTGHYHGYGFELGGEKRWDNGRLLKLTWTHNYVRDEVLDGGTGGWAADSPKNLVKLHYSEPFFNDKIRLSFEELFVDQIRTLNNNILPAYHLFNINVSLAKSWHGLQPSLGIYNVLGHRYKVLGGSEHEQDSLAMDGRSVRFRLDYQF